MCADSQRPSHDHTAVHASHCCFQHGCKYGDDDCPVASGQVKQLYDCEECYNDRMEIELQSEEEAIARIRQTLQSYARYSKHPALVAKVSALLEQLEQPGPAA